jgi:hypothetical protein
MNTPKIEMEVTHKDGRRGKILAIQEQRALVAWEKEDKIQKSWARFHNLQILHLPPITIKRPSGLAEMARLDPGVWVVAGCFVAELSNNGIIDDVTHDKIIQYFIELNPSKNNIDEKLV